MAMHLTRKEIHRQLYLAGLLLLAAAIPLSHYFMSLAQLILFVNWLVEGDLHRKLKQFFANKAVLAFCLIFFMLVVGLIFTKDFDYALKDLRTKVPLLLLPLIISTSDPVSKKSRDMLISLFIAAVLGGSLASTGLYFSKEFSNIRSIFPFISHIRFSLSVVMAMVFLVFLIRDEHPYFALPRYLYYALLLWFLFFLILAQSLTGLCILMVISIVAIVFYLAHRLSRRQQALVFSVLMLMFVLGIVLLLGQARQAIAPKPLPISGLEMTTANGNPYFHDTTATQSINGHQIWVYICEPELKAGWNRRSKYDFEGEGRNGLEIKNVLFRFMTSKGLRKDSLGLSGLTNKEIYCVEGGCVDARDINANGLAVRYRALLWEYQSYRDSGNASGFSLMMRIEYWKASLAIIKENFWYGVGTGDMNDAFDKYYEDTHSKLSPEWRRRSHNQYLSVTVGFGIFGLFLFLFALLYPAYKLGKMRQGVFLYFLLILMLSMLTEDTIESQAGVTFAAFFYCFLLFLPQAKMSTFES